MHKKALEAADYALIGTANSQFQKSLQKDWHGVASALLLRSGKIVTAFVLEAENPSLTVCAEPIALGKALEDMATDPVTTVVAVRAREKTEHKVIPPCGRCREFITDYCPDANVIVHDEKANELIKVPAGDLLPFKYRAEPS